MALNLRQLLAHGPEKITVEKVKIWEWPLQEIGLTLGYVCVAGLWCVFADDIFDWMMGVPVDSAALQAMKWINFITTTSLVLYLILRRTSRNRRLAEEAQRLTQERFESVARATTDAIWDLNLESKVLWWSDGLQRLFGYPPEEVSTKFDWWLSHLHPEDANGVLDALHLAIDKGANTWTCQYRFRRHDGSYAVVSDRSYIIHDAKGKPTRMVGGIADISERRQAEEALEKSRLQLRALAARLQAGREEERTTVAREVHDELGQVLTAIKINLDWLERHIDNPEAKPQLDSQLERVVETAEMVDTAIQSVQRIATDLRPPILDNLGLLAAIETETRRFQQRYNIPCELQLPDEPLDLSRELGVAIFRVFQEALTNVARHAQATQVRVRLQADNAHVLLQVQDNGRGIRPEAIIDSRSLGLLGMRERAAVFGGDVAVAPIAPNGTQVTLRVRRLRRPFPAESNHA